MDKIIYYRLSSSDQAHACGFQFHKKIDNSSVSDVTKRLCIFTTFPRIE